MTKTKPTFGILVLAFNRPDVLKRSLNALRANSDLSDTSVFLSLDGPRQLRDRDLVHQCRIELDVFLSTVPSASVITSATNQGLRRNVLKSVTTAFKSVEHLLVLEDDCLIGDTTVPYFNWGFRELAASDSIGAVSGSYLGIENKNLAFLAQRFNSWGWGSNRGIWKAFLESKYAQEPLTGLVPELRRIVKTSPMYYKYEYRKIARNLSRLDSWAIPFDLFLRSQDLYTVKPTVNQIQNIGFEAMATHTFKGSSLSIEVASINQSNLELASLQESEVIEKSESWHKFRKLAKESIFGIPDRS